MNHPYCYSAARDKKDIKRVSHHLESHIWTQTNSLCILGHSLTDQRLPKLYRKRKKGDAYKNKYSWQLPDPEIPCVNCYIKVCMRWRQLVATCKIKVGCGLWLKIQIILCYFGDKLSVLSQIFPMLLVGIPTRCPR